MVSGVVLAIGLAGFVMLTARILAVSVRRAAVITICTLALLEGVGWALMLASGCGNECNGALQDAVRGAGALIATAPMYLAFWLAPVFVLLAVIRLATAASRHVRSRTASS